MEEGNRRKWKNRLQLGWSLPSANTPGWRSVREPLTKKTTIAMKHSETFTLWASSLYLHNDVDNMNRHKALFQQGCVKCRPTLHWTTYRSTFQRLAVVTRDGQQKFVFLSLVLKKDETLDLWGAPRGVDDVAVGCLLKWMGHRWQARLAGGCFLRQYLSYDDGCGGLTRKSTGNDARKGRGVCTALLDVWISVSAMDTWLAILSLLSVLASGSRQYS